MKELIPTIVRQFRKWSNWLHKKLPHLNVALATNYFNVFMSTTVLLKVVWKNWGPVDFWGASNFSNLLAPWASGSRSLMLRAVNRPAFEGTVPHFHQMSRVPRNETDVPHLKKIALLFFSLQIILHFCLVTQQSDKLPIKLGPYVARRQTPSIFHVRQPSSTTVYFFNAAHRQHQHCYR